VQETIACSFELAADSVIEATPTSLKDSSLATRLVVATAAAASEIVVWQLLVGLPLLHVL